MLQIKEQYSPVVTREFVKGRPSIVKVERSYNKKKKKTITHVSVMKRKQDVETRSYKSSQNMEEQRITKKQSTIIRLKV